MPTDEANLVSRPPVIPFVKGKIQQDTKEIDSYSQLSKPINEEEIKIIRDLYELKEEEGLDRFDSSLTKLHEYENGIAQSPELKELSSLIAETNKKLQMRFKREHEYKLEQHEEQLYKEVLFDMRSN